MMLSAQIIDYNKLREGFVDKSKKSIPPSLMPYSSQWEASATYFFELFLSYLKEQRMEVRFREDF